MTAGYLAIDHVIHKSKKEIPFRSDSLSGVATIGGAVVGVAPGP